MRTDDRPNSAEALILRIDQSQPALGRADAVAYVGYAAAEF